MTITRDAADVWNEICDKAERRRLSGEPIYTLVRKVPNRIIKVENDRIWRQSEEPFSESEWGAWIRLDGRGVQSRRLLLIPHFNRPKQVAGAPFFPRPIVGFDMSAAMQWLL